MKVKISKKAKIVTLSSIFVLLCMVLALSTIGIYFSNRKPRVDNNINPTQWNIDKWNGKTENADNFLSGEQFANRGEKVFTINSAESFIHFVNLTQNGEQAAEYNYFKNYTIYLNTSIDLANNPTEQIGKKLPNGESTFQGTFDGSYYTIFNANLKGGLFGYTTNATIKNIGLYNANIESKKAYTGGILDEGVDTTIADVYVQAGNIKGNNVGGLVGKMSLTKPNTLTNSFADTKLEGATEAGLINRLSVIEEDETQQEITYTINQCYFTNSEKAILDSQIEIDNSTILSNPSKNSFYQWNYKPEFDMSNQWCDYSGEDTLKFNLPILTKFNKTFLSGCYYENVLVKDNGKVENLESLSSAFNLLTNGDSAEVNLIVEKITVDEPAVLTADATLTLNAAVDTTLTRGKNNTQNLIVSTGNSNLTIGTENATTTITIDGNRQYVESTGGKSSSAIYTTTNQVTINKNVIIQNNINNADGFGGGLFIATINEGSKLIELYADIVNCEANYGGGIYIADNLNDDIKSFLSLNYLSKINFTELEDLSTYRIYGSVKDNVANQNGGGVYANFNLKNSRIQIGDYQNLSFITGNSSKNGGGVCIIGKMDFETFLDLESCVISNNEAAETGGGIYAKDYVTINTSYVCSDDNYNELIDNYASTLKVLLTSTISNIEQNKKSNFVTISNNTASQVGGLYLSYGVFSNEVLATITNNISTLNLEDPNVYAVSPIATYYYRLFTYGSASVPRISASSTYTCPSYDSVTLTPSSKYGYSEISSVKFTGCGYNTNGGTSRTYSSGSKITLTSTSSSNPTIIYECYTITSGSGPVGITFYYNSSSQTFKTYINVTTGGTYNYQLSGAVNNYIDDYSGSYTQNIQVMFSPVPASGCNGFWGWSTSSGTPSTSPSGVTEAQALDFMPTAKSYYAIFIKTTAASNTSSSRTIKFYSGSSSTYQSRSQSYTTTTSEKTQYYNYNGSSSSSAVGGSTSTSYSPITSYSSATRPSSLSSSFTLFGWNSDSGTAASSYVSVSTNKSFTPSSTSYYAVWRNTSYTAVTDTYAVKFYYNGSIYTTITQQKTATGTAYADYLGNIDTKPTSGGSWVNITTPTSVSSRPSGVTSSYTVYGWNDSDTKAASSSVTYTAGQSVNPSSQSFYAVYRYYSMPSRPLRTIYFDYDETNTPVSQTGVTSGRDIYKNYQGTTGTDTGGETTYSSEITAPSVTSTGYTFKGWVADSTKNSYNAGSGNIIAANASFVPSQTTYYATWQKDTAAYSTEWTNSSTKTINYNWGTGSGSKNSDTLQIQSRNNYTAKTEYFNYNKTSTYTSSTGGTQTKSYQGSINLPAATIGTYVGYNLVKWHLGSASGTEYALGAEYKITSNDTAAVTFFAEWSVKTYKVAGTGGTKGSVSASKTTDIAYNEAITISWRSAGEQGNNYALTNVKIYSGTSTSGTLLDTITTGTSKSWNMSALDPAVYAENIYIYVTYTSSFVTYTIDIKLSGGGTDYTKTGTYGTAVEIATPTRTGYTFEGWTAVGLNTATAKYGTDSSPSTSWADGKTKVKGTYFLNLSVTQGDTVTLTANWVENGYTITLSLAGGQCSTKSPVSATFDKDVTIENPTKTGYTFAGWTASSTALYSGALAGGAAWTGTANKATTFKNLVATASGSITLTATWTVNKVTYTAAANKGTISPTSGSVNFNADVTFSYSNANKTGYHYSGATLTIYTGTDNTGTKLIEVNDGSSYTFNYESLDKGYTANVYVYVTYTETANSYSITLSLAGGQCTTKSPVSATFDKDVAIANPTKVGYTFAGWTASNLYSGALAGGKAWDGTSNKATTFKNLVSSNSGTITLTATWTVNKVTYTAEANNGTINPASGSVDFNKDVTFSYSNANKTGYHYSGATLTIYTGTDNTGTKLVEINDGSSYKFNYESLNKGYTANVYVYVTYTETANSYSITLSLAGGQCTTSSPVSATFDKDVAIANPTRTGYTFAGWTASNLYSGALAGGKTWDGAANKATTFKNLVATEDGSITLTATWTANKVNYTAVANNGTISPTSGSVDFNKDVTFTYSNANKTGYHYSGATLTIYAGTDNTGTKLVEVTDDSSYTFNYELLNKGFTENVYVYVTYTETANPYTIELEYNNGQAKGSVQANFDADVSIPNPSKVGYDFAGWTAKSTDLYSGALAGGAAWTGTANKATVFKNLVSGNSGSIKLTATWTEKSYTIHTGGSNGKVTAPSSKKYTEDFEFSWTNDIATGYIFTFKKVEIFPNSTNSGSSIFSYTGSENNATFNMSTNETSKNAYYADICIYVTYEKTPINYTIVEDFGYDGKEDVSISAVFDTANEITNPTRIGYKFTGFTATINNDTAQFGARENSLAKWDGSLTSTTAAETSTWFKNLCTNEGDSITITANWQVLTYTINFRTENGNITCITSGQQFNYNQDVAISYANAGKIGYKYPNPAELTIYKNEEGSENILQTQHGGASLTFNMSTFKDINNATGNYYDTIFITLHYDEEAIKYNIDYTLNNGNYTGKAVQQATYDKPFEILQPTRVGYEFVGWTSTTLKNTAQAGTTQENLQTWNGKTQNVGTWFNNLTFVENETVTLIANWEALSYNIHTKATESTISVDVGETGKFDQPIEITFAGLIEKGFTFTFESLKIYEGTEENHSNELKSFEEFPNPQTWTMTNTYYPDIYIEVVYSRAYSNRTLTADANGGTINETEGWLVNGEFATKSLIYESNYGTLPTATRQGYVFDGWYTLEENGELVQENFVITEDTTIYAHWRLDITDSSSFKITYDKTIVYKGRAITTADLHLTITYKNTTTLTNEDYVVKSQSNNLNVTDNATITIEGKGNYAAEVTLIFSITPKDINSADIEISPLGQEFVYNETYYEPKPTITDTTRSVVLQETSEYSLSYANNRDASTETIKATITITGVGNYGQTRDFTFDIKPRDITNAKVQLNKTSFVYNAKSQTPTITVTLGDKQIASTDYVVSYETSSHQPVTAPQIIDVDTYTVIITGVNNATGVNKTAEFSIIPLDLSGKDVQVVLSPENLTFIYNRAAQNPTIQSITIGTFSLNLAEDDSDIVTEIYAKTDETRGSILEQSIDAGSYYLVIKSNGKTYLTGEYQVEYKINPASLTGASLVLTEQESEFDNTDKQIEIESVTTNEDNHSLTLTYNEQRDSSEYYIVFTRKLGKNDDKRNVGEITVTVYSCSINFEGSVSTTYNITPADISKVKPSTIANLVYNRKAQTPSFTLNYMEFTLVDGVDFTAKYLNNLNAGIATIEITALTNYDETAQRFGNFVEKDEKLTLSFTIDKATIDSLELTQTEENYNQNAHSIGIKQVLANSTQDLIETLTVNATEYKIEYYRYVDVTVDYLNQTKDFTTAGKILVKVVPNEDLENVNFDGYATADFEIKKVTLTGIELDTYIYTYNTKPQHPSTITVTSGELTLSEDEFSISYYRDDRQITKYEKNGENKDYINAGTIELRLTLTEKGELNYEGTLETSYIIDPKNIEDKDVTIKYYFVNAEGKYVDNGGKELPEGSKEELGSEQIYVGQLVRPELQFVSGDQVLENLKWEDLGENLKDYTYKITNKNEPEKVDNFSHVGNYSLTTTGQNNYTGTLKVDYRVNPASLTAEGIEVTLTPYQYIYTSKPIEIYSIEDSSNPSPEDIEAIDKIINITYEQTEGDGGLTTLSYGTDYIFYTGWFDYHEVDGKPVGKVDANTNDTTIYITKGYYEGSNIDVGKTFVYLEGKKDYFNVINVEFEIVKAELTQDDLDIEYTQNYTYNGFEFKPVPTIKWNDLTLENGKNYTYSYTNNTNATTKDSMAYINIHCLNKNIEFTDFDLPFTISQHNINDEENIAVNGVKNFEYNTKNQYPTISLVYTSTPVADQVADEESKIFTLENTKDYTIIYKHNGEQIEPTQIIDAGSYSIEITGIGNYTGTRIVEFTINQNLVTLGNLTETSSTFNNQDKFGNIKITLTDSHGVNVLEDLESNFIIKYLRKGEITDDFKNAGEITIEISSLEGSNYKIDGKIILTYTIEQLDLNEANLNVTIADKEFNGTKFEPKADEFIVMFAEYQLVENTDFTIKSYGENTSKTDLNGTAYVTIEGMGNFKNLYIIYFKISGVNLGEEGNDNRIKIDGTTKNEYQTKEYVYDAKVHKYTPVITVDDIQLIEGQDVNFTYYRYNTELGNFEGKTTDDFKNVGRIKIVIEGVGNYGSSFEIEYNILQKDIAEDTNINSSVKSNYTYSSEALHLANGELDLTTMTINYTANGDEVTLTITKGTDYSVKYFNNENPIEVANILDVGNYQIVITGINNFDGEYRINFVVDKFTIKNQEEGLPEGFEIDVPELTFKNEQYEINEQIVVKYKLITIPAEHYEIAIEPAVVLNARTYKLTVTFNQNSNFEGALITTFEVKQADISAATGFEKLFEGDKSNFTYSYTGNNVLELIKQNIFMFETQLIFNTDFTISTESEGFVDVGDFSIKIVGKGNYTNELEISFKIGKLDVSNLDPDSQKFDMFIPEYTYEEDETYDVENDLRVEFNGEVVDKSQYTVTVVPKDVSNAGEYNVTVEFNENSNFSGKLTTQFNVNKKTLSFEVKVTDRIYFEQELLTDILANDLIVSGDYDNETLALIGSISFDAAVLDESAKLIVGEQKIYWTFTPSNSNYSIITGRFVTITARKIELVSIKVKANDNIIEKLTFTAYDNFDESNLTLLISRNNGSISEIKFEDLKSNNQFAYTISLTDGKVTTATNSLSVVYTENEITKTCSILVEIKAIELTINANNLNDIVEGITLEELNKHFELGTVVDAYANRLNYLMGNFAFYKDNVEQTEISSGDYVAKFIFENDNFKINEQENNIEFYVKSKTLTTENNLIYAVCEKGFDKGVQLKFDILTGKDDVIQNIKENNSNIGDIEYVYVITFVDDLGDLYTPSGDYKIFFNKSSFSRFRIYKLFEDEDSQRVEEITNEQGEFIEVFANSVGMIVVCNIPNNMNNGIKWIIFFIILLILLIIIILTIIGRIRSKRKRQKMVDELNEENIGKKKKSSAK